MKTLMIREVATKKRVKQEITRREAVKQLITGAGAVVVATSGLGSLLSACGGAESGGDVDETSDAVACTAGVTVSVGTDKISPHTHSISLTIEQITAQAEIEITLLSQSRSGTDLAHTHWVTVTAEQLTHLVSGDAITVISDMENTSGDEGDAHDHMFEIFCA